ncbi:FAD dependent oxidoreductase [Thalassoporum mexicanum PCC 7367]|uniref:FAD-dependent oxidoreductase n=1 Tax=Thalassoporum mexicanum TaxID=3457544 RepID=UPI00029FC169|nr:FAD-dependent oxidoreductase [Pseudanabaena sp. PCC 7367]AFY69586.1 FAD dependent oxidoreductase [Pseudanabaena sp. PCC 7367]
MQLRQFLTATSFATTTAITTTIVAIAAPVNAAQPPRIDQQIECEILIVGGGLSGTAAAYEGLLAGRTVCMTEITDWVGGQISAQGTSALDERPTQREMLFYDRGYKKLRDRIEEKYGRLNPGGCWVSASCFFPQDGHEILLGLLREAEAEGNGKLNLLFSTVIKDLEITDGQIRSAIAITHTPATGAPPLNTFPLSQIMPEAYRYDNSERFTKTVTKFIPQPPKPDPETGLPVPRPANSPDWYVIEATETGEIVGLADVPYRLGIDPLSPREPSSSSKTADNYCTQGFTYTFAMEATAEPQNHQTPELYAQYAPYYSYELERLASFPFVFTYRRIHTPTPEFFETVDFSFYKEEEAIVVGDISMQNWTWGNDYRPGTSKDNLIYSRDQLQSNGQLNPGGWLGGLRVKTLSEGERISWGYFHWLVSGTTDSRLDKPATTAKPEEEKSQPSIKQPRPNNRFLSGLDSPMGTEHGLSKYPYMREGRRIIGRPSWGNPEGFKIAEIDISRRDYNDEYYKTNLPEDMYRKLRVAIAGLEKAAVISGDLDSAEIPVRARSTIYPDAVGIGHYAIDFHPCLVKYPVETPGNFERPGERRGQGQAYPFQIPLRAMIPQNLDNLIVAGKSVATSHIAAAAYRVHSFEWSSGVAAGTVADFALENAIAPFEMVDDLPRQEPQLEAFQQRLRENGNPISFPDTSIFNEDWEDWK